MKLLQGKCSGLIGILAATCSPMAVAQEMPPALVETVPVREVGGRPLDGLAEVVVVYLDPARPPVGPGAVPGAVARQAHVLEVVPPDHHLRATHGDVLEGARLRGLGRAHAKTAF